MFGRDLPPDWAFEVLHWGVVAAYAGGAILYVGIMVGIFLLLKPRRPVGTVARWPARRR